MIPCGLCMHFHCPARLLRNKQKTGTWRTCILSQNLDDFERYRQQNLFWQNKFCPPLRFSERILFNESRAIKGTEWHAAPQGSASSPSPLSGTGRKDRSPQRGEVGREMRMVRAWVDGTVRERYIGHIRGINAYPKRSTVPVKLPMNSIQHSTVWIASLEGVWGRETSLTPFLTVP